MLPARLGLFLVSGVVVLGSVYYATELLVGFFLSEAGFAGIPKSKLIQPGIRLCLVLGLGITALRRVNGARWTLVVFFATWSLERIYWAAKGFPVSAVVAPIFVLCALALASRPSSAFINRAV